MDFKQFVAVLRRRWLSVVSLVAVTVGVASLLSFVVMTPKFESKSTVFLSVDVRESTDAITALYFAQTRATAYADLANSNELAQRVVDALDLDMTSGQLSGEISAEVVETTSLIQLKVTDTSARRAQTINDVLTDQFTRYISELETPGGSASGESPQITAQVTDKASYNPTQVSPRSALNLVVAALVGLMMGIALALVRELLDRTVRTADHVTELTESPVLASVGFDSDMAGAPLLTDLGGFAARTEAFRLLRTNLQFVDLDNQPRCLVITSAVPGEGKTMTATNLAVALAQTGRNTLIIDADLRRPRVANTLGLDPAIGLTTALIGRTEIHDAIQVHEPSGLHVLASGAKPPNPTEILQSRITQDLVARLRASYDIVIIDAPPLLPVADTSVLATLCDGVILVVRHASTTRDQVTEAVSRVAQVGGRLYGVVVNMVAKRAIGSYYYYYYEETGPERSSGRNDRPSSGGKRAAPR